MVFAARIRQKLLMGTMLDNMAVIKYHNLIAETARSQSVGNINSRFISRNRVEVGVNLIFGDRIERSRRLIQENKR